MDAQKRIKEFMEERNWSEYRLAKEAGLSQSTISNIFVRNTMPSLQTLEAICEGLGITLGQFFSEDNLVPLSQEQRELFRVWVSLPKEHKKLVEALIRALK